ncbi:MAG: cytochrome c biogenesis protein, partial [Polaromonas sp.]
MNTTTVNTPTVNTTTLTAGRNTTLSLNEGYFAKRNALDWVFAALVVVGCLYAFVRYSAFMDVYEKGILLGTIPAAIAMGWFWRPLRVLMMVVSGFALLGIASYQVDGAGNLARAEQVFWLKYFLSSQSAILWMSVLFFMSTIFYWLGMIAKGQSSTLESLGSKIAWVAVGMALIGTLVRWYESYLIGADVGHIPVSNLYEVFVLFCWMTAAFYLYFEAQYNTRALGAFVMLVVSAAVGFLLWYTVVREAHEIQPLVPALKSWWMKLHVPANFIGYGMFSLSAMVSLSYLIKQQAAETRWYRLTPLWLLGVVLCFVPIVFRKSPADVGGSNYWAGYLLVSGLIAAGILLGRK